MENEMKEVMMIGLLTPMAVLDLLKKKINILWIAGFAAAGLLTNCVENGWGTADILSGSLVGLILVIISVKSKALGIGDGILFIAIGWVIGFWECLYLLSQSMILCMIIGAAERIFFHKPKNYQMPFVPFIFIGYLLFLIQR